MVIRLGERLAFFVGGALTVALVQLLRSRAASKSADGDLARNLESMVR